MATTNYVLITDDFYNEIEDQALDALQGDPASLTSLVEYAKDLDRIADSPAYSEHREDLAPLMEWIRRGADVGDFEGEDGEVDEERFFDEIVGPIEETTQLLGRLMVPLAGEAYDPQMELGRLFAEQIPAYSADQPQATLDGVRYSFVELLELTD